VLAALISPVWASIIAFAMLRPSPVPSVLLPLSFYFNFISSKIVARIMPLNFDICSGLRSPGEVVFYAEIINE
jgi:hypothetical protein